MRELAKRINYEATSSYFYFVVFDNIYAADTLGTIGRIHVYHDNGKVFFWINAETSNYASCATIQRYVIDSTTEPGKSTLSTILYLKASGQNVEIYVAGNCALHADPAGSLPLGYLIQQRVYRS